jgi:glycosyltransferase involved in cell wall biosynthesis
MKVAFDFNAVVTHRFSGLYSVGAGLLRGFDGLLGKPEFLLFYSNRYHTQTKQAIGNLTGLVHLKPTFVKMRWLENLWRYSSYPRLESFTGKFDIYHCFHHLMPPTKGRPRVMTVHDLRRYKLPDLYKKSRLDLFESAVKRADHFMAVSESTKHDLCNIMDISESKVDVVHLAAGLGFASFSQDEKNQIKANLAKQINTPLNRYLAVISSSDKRKNIWRVTQAFKKAQEHLPANIKLVIIGNLPEYSAREKQASIPSDENIILTGPVDNIADWLGCADALVFASLYEGFGVPILEAFACGVPVITSNCSSMPEVAGEAALYVDPYSAESVSQAIVQVCNNAELRNKLIIAGTQRSKQFSWHQSAAKTLEVYKKFI